MPSPRRRLLRLLLCAPIVRRWKLGMLSLLRLVRLLRFRLSKNLRLLLARNRGNPKRLHSKCLRRFLSLLRLLRWSHPRQSLMTISPL